MKHLFHGVPCIVERTFQGKATIWTLSGGKVYTQQVNASKLKPFDPSTLTPSQLADLYELEDAFEAQMEEDESIF